MTLDRDLDRSLVIWLDESAVVSPPEDLLARTLARVDATTQRPGWLVRGGMAPGAAGTSARPRIVGFAAAALVLAAAFITALGGGRWPFPTASPSPSPAPTPSPTASFVPEALRATWVGPTRTPPEGTSGIVQSAFNLSTRRLEFYPGAGDPILTSTATWLGGNRLAFRLDRAEVRCQSDDLGTYTFALNPTSRALTIATASDPCKARAVLISGDWARADCPNRDSLCLGDLDPGKHFSAQFNPFVPRNTYVYDYGRLSYAVPDGWSNAVDGPDGFFLVEQAAPAGGSIQVNSTAIADSQAADCPGTQEPGIGRTSAALADWLASLPGVAATAPTPLTLGGLRGYTLDLTIKPSWTRACPYSDGKPYVAMLTNGLPGDINFDWGLAAGGKVRVFLLDLPDGRTMLIHVEAADETTWDRFIVDAMPIVESFEFHP